MSEARSPTVLERLRDDDRVASARPNGSDALVIEFVVGLCESERYRLLDAFRAGGHAVEDIGDAYRIEIKRGEPDE